MVVYLFLQGWRATLIPLLAVPVSLIGTFIFFPLFGFSINTLSLFGLVLAIGLVVDDAIVVVEAVERHIEEGLRSEGRRAQGDGGDLRPGDRHRAGSLGGVRADGVHSRHHRPPVSAVRGDHRDLGDPLGVQRADAEPGAGGAAAQAEDRKATGLLRRFFDWFNRMFGRATERLCPLVRRADPQERGRARRCWSVAGVGAAFFSGKVPTSFLPDEDQGYCLPAPAASQRRFAASAPEAAAQRSRRSCCTRPA